MSPEQFKRARREGNDALLELSESARTLADLDGRAYQAGGLDALAKEYMGLAISFAKNCEECVFYHLEQLHRLGATRTQLAEAFDVALVGCGSVAFPLARRAVAFLQQLDAAAEQNR